MRIIPVKPSLRVFSGVCINLFAVWFLGIFISSSVISLTVNSLGAIVSLLLAIHAEHILEDL